VRQLAEHFNKSPDKITEEELRQYFLHIKNDKKWSRTAAPMRCAASNFLRAHSNGNGRSSSGPAPCREKSAGDSQPRRSTRNSQ
jgi:hypothetical protein